MVMSTGRQRRPSPPPRPRSRRLVRTPSCLTRRRIPPWRCTCTWRTVSHTHGAGLSLLRPPPTLSVTTTRIPWTAPSPTLRTTSPPRQTTWTAPACGWPRWSLQCDLATHRRPPCWQQRTPQMTRLKRRQTRGTTSSARLARLCAGAASSCLQSSRMRPGSGTRLGWRTLRWTEPRARHRSPSATMAHRKRACPATRWPPSHGCASRGGS